MKQILYVFLLIYPFLCWSQREITVGPYEDCKQLKEGRNQINTRSEWFNLGGVSELNIWTLQHDTFDKSRIYDENGNYIPLPERTPKQPSILVSFIHASYNKYCPKIDWE